MTKEEFKNLQIGTVIRNKRSKLIYTIVQSITNTNTSSVIYEIKSQNYLNIYSYLNENSCKDYENVKE